MSKRKLIAQDTDPLVVDLMVILTVLLKRAGGAVQMSAAEVEDIFKTGEMVQKTYEGDSGGFSLKVSECGHLPALEEDMRAEFVEKLVKNNMSVTATPPPAMLQQDLVSIVIDHGGTVSFDPRCLDAYAGTNLALSRHVDSATGRTTIAVMSGAGETIN